MPHCTPEQLALAALREPLPETDTDHLDACAECRAEVASLQRGVDALAVPELAAPRTPVAPPPSVWAGIAAATGVSAALDAGTGHGRVSNALKNDGTTELDIRATTSHGNISARSL